MPEPLPCSEEQRSEEPLVQPGQRLNSGPFGTRDRSRALADFLAQAGRLILEGCKDVEGVFGHSIGMHKLVGFFLGEDSAFMRQNRLSELPLYGVLRWCRRRWVQRLIESLRASGYLKVTGTFRPVLCLSEEGGELLESLSELPILPREILRDPVLGPACPASPLEARLREVRAYLGRKLHRTPRQIVSDELLRRLADQPPGSNEELRGLLPPKLQEYSAAFWHVLKNI